MADEIASAAINLAAEAIQVAAMANKFELSNIYPAVDDEEVHK